MSLRVLTVAAAATLAAIAAPALAAGPLSMTTRMMVEKRVTAADGSTRTTLVPAAKAVPGERITVVLAYRNAGTAPIGNLVLANPVPRNVAFRAAAAGSAAPDVSVDGKSFGNLAELRVTTPDGATRPATASDVTHVRWRLSSPLSAGQGGEFAFQAVLK
jgi:uncharacterized repeat protein (TIGR01451 family)